MAAASTASTAIKRKIARLRREIERIDAFFYTNSPDYVDLAWTLELKRDDMVRAIVLQLHTSTEDLLNIRTINRILAGRGRRSTRSNAARALRKLFYGAGSIGFDAKLNLALAIGLIDLRTKELEQLADQMQPQLAAKCSASTRKEARSEKTTLADVSGDGTYIKPPYSRSSVTSTPTYTSSYF